MANKNYDSHSFNRNGLFDFENMTIKSDDEVFDLKAEFQKLDGFELSINCVSEMPIKGVSVV